MQNFKSSIDHRKSRILRNKIKKGVLVIMNSNNSNINYFINGSKWIKLGLLDKGLVIISRISYRGKNIIHFIFYTTIEHLMTVTGSSNSTFPMSMSIANCIT